jgi:hypothetical protein
MADRLFQQIQQKNFRDDMDATDKLADISVWQEVGGAREEDADELKLLALTSPLHYSQLRNNALAEVRVATIQAYHSAFKQQLKARVPEKQAKAEALKVANATKKFQMDTMKLRFPDEDTKVYINKAARQAQAFV